MSTWRGLVEPSASHTYSLDEVFHESSGYGIISTKAMSSARTRKRQMGCLQTDLLFIVRIGRMPVNEENEVLRVGTAEML